MKYLTLALISISLLYSSQAQQLDYFQNLQFSDDHDYTPTENVNWYVALMRGAWTGFLEGLYNQATAVISDECLDQNIANRLIRFYNNTQKGENPLTIVQSVLDLAAFINNFNECGIEKLMTDLGTFCLQDKKNCQMETIVLNLQKNVFQVIAKVNEIAQTYVDFPTLTNEQINKEGNVIGKNVGQLVRAVLNIQMM